MSAHQDAPPRALNPRLRASCNDCGTAKVKCDRVRPACGRCVDMSLHCVYGVSRLAGKPQRSRQSATDRRRPYGAALSPSSSSSLRSMRDASAVSTAFQPLPTTMPYTTPGGVGQLAGLDPLSSLLLPDTTSGTFAPIRPVRCEGVESQGSLDPAFCLSPGTWPLDPWPAAASDLTTQAPSAPYCQRSSSPVVPLALPDLERHDCSKESNRILGSLELATSLSEITTSTILARLDHVLQANRHAIDDLSRVLACSCSKAPYLIMLHATIVSRIFNWYQQAAGFADHLPPNPATGPSEDSASPAPSVPSMASFQSSHGTPNGLEMPSSLSGGISDAATDLPFSLGKFHIDQPCVQFAFRNLLIGHELKRAGRLVDIFASQQHAGKEGELHASMTAWLKDEHARSIRTVRSAIRELNNHIDL